MRPYSIMQSSRLDCALRGGGSSNFVGLIGLKLCALGPEQAQLAARLALVVGKPESCLATTFGSQVAPVEGALSWIQSEWTGRA